MDSISKWLNAIIQLFNPIFINNKRYLTRIMRALRSWVKFIILKSSSRGNIKARALNALVINDVERFHESGKIIGQRWH